MELYLNQIYFGQGAYGVQAAAKTYFGKNVEDLDLTGGYIKVKYNDNTEEQISMTSANISSNGFNNKAVGKNTINISYLGKSTTFDVDIKVRQIISAVIVQEPEVTTITDEEEMDYSGGSVEVTYSDKTKEEVPFDSPNVKIYDSGDVVVSEDEVEEDRTMIVEYKGIKNKFDYKIQKLSRLYGTDEIYDDEIDYAVYGDFYDAVKMKPSEVIMSIVKRSSYSLLTYHYFFDLRFH